MHMKHQAMARGKDGGTARTRREYTFGNALMSGPSIPLLTSFSFATHSGSSVPRCCAHACCHQTGEHHDHDRRI